MNRAETTLPGIGPVGWFTALESLPNAVVVYDAECRILYLNRAGRIGAGLSSEEVVGRRDAELFPEHARREYLPYLERAFASREPVSGECRVMTSGRDGREPRLIVFSVTYTPILDSNGALECIVGITTDLTAARRFETEAEELHRLLSNAGVALTTVDSNGAITSVNLMVQHLYGRTAEELVGRRLAELVQPSEANELEERLARAIKGAVIDYEGRRRHKDGRALDLALTLSPVRDALGRIVAITECARDLSERRELERRVLDARHLETVSRAVAGIAHELNDALTVIENYTALLAEEPLPEAQRLDLEMARRGARRGAALVRQLLGFHRGPSSGERNVDIGVVLCELAVSLPRLFGMRISFGPLPKGLMVRADIVKIQQLVLAQANYVDSMCGGGPLLLQSEVSSVARGELCTHVKVTVSSPLQAATEAREGVDGSEAWLLQELANELGGRLRIDVLERNQLSVAAELPLIQARTTSEPVAASRHREEPTVVLLAEDDPDIRAALTRILHRKGYAVLAAADAAEAVKLAAEHVGPIHLMLSDQLMPDAQGVEAIARVRALRRDLRAVLVSGHPDRPDAPADIEFLQKPFSPDDLLSTIERALTERPSEAPLSERPVVLVVDDDPEVRHSMRRLLSECDLVTVTAPSGLHALQLLQERRVDAIVADQIMPGMDGVHLLGIVRERWPEATRVLLTGYPSSDVVLEAVNQGGAHKVLLKSMHALQIRNEIESAALIAARRRGRR